MKVVNEIFALYTEHGSRAYFDEPVSELEHALQAAAQAQNAQAAPSLIAAALMHDIGHLRQRLPENIAAHGIDAKHEKIGADWLAQHFLPSVSEPVRLHVAAKRYLCATDRGYIAMLSAASRQSLTLQGGAMSKTEAEEFIQVPHFRAALRLRWWDDKAKVAQRKVIGLESYRALLVSLLK